ncbi:MAG: WD40/YVTN/BNR-like repeat-containing protein, partial [Bacteroidia bacterium]
MKKHLYTFLLALLPSIFLHSQWVQQTSGTTATLFSVHFVSAAQGWACGTGGTMVSTIDGGQNWVPQTSGVATPLNAVWFADALNG